MNSDELIRRLNVMLNDNRLSDDQKAELESAIRHIQKQDDEILDLKEDITDWGDSK